MHSGCNRSPLMVWSTQHTLCACVCECVCVAHRESYKRLALPRSTKDRKPRNIYNEPKQLSTGSTQRPSTTHYRKGSPGVKPHNTNQHSSHARLQHSNHPPSLPAPNRAMAMQMVPGSVAQPLLLTCGCTAWVLSRLAQACDV